MDAETPAGILARLRGVLPRRWFADPQAPDTPSGAPVLDAVLLGLADSWVWLHQLLAQVRAQTRLATATGEFLDFAARDFLGPRLLRREGEADDAFRARLLRALRRSRATRPALVEALVELTGREPDVFEPARPADTGGYGEAGGLAWAAAGGWGSLSLPCQCFVTARRPRGQGIALLGGYGTAGPLAYGTPAMIRGQATDEEIFAAVADALPAGTTAWTRIVS